MFCSDSSIRSTNSDSDSTADHLPDSVNAFFQSVRMNCFPEAEGMDTKAQPWRRIWAGPQPPSTDGKLLVACPKNCLWGKFYSYSKHLRFGGWFRESCRQRFRSRRVLKISLHFQGPVLHTRSLWHSECITVHIFCLVFCLVFCIRLRWTAHTSQRSPLG
jgi:hypothetical protein